MIGDRRGAAVAAAAIALWAAPASAACVAGVQPSLSATVRAVADLDAAWADYKRRHVEPDGRVVDSANGGISHSEGQGYAMLIAAKLADRDTFDRVFAWTVANLGIREDRLFAWRWSPETTPPVTDANNATDGDILVVWALMEAAELWDEPVYRAAAEAIAADIARHTVHPSPVGPLLMPAAAGFGPEHRDDGPVVNLSYYIFPAEAALAEAAPLVDWAEVFAVGRRLLDTPDSLFPPEWSSVGPEGSSPAASFAPVFGYNAVRIPLYVAWNGCDEGLLARFHAVWRVDPQAPRQMDAITGLPGEPFAEPGYRAVPALLACALGDGGGPAGIGAPEQNYYPQTLQILATIAQLETYPWCID